MPEAPAPAPARFDDLITTADTFDIAVYGEVYAVTTHLTGALLGKALRLRNSAWPGYSGGESHTVVRAVRARTCSMRPWTGKRGARAMWGVEAAQSEREQSRNSSGYAGKRHALASVEMLICVS